MKRRTNGADTSAPILAVSFDATGTLISCPRLSDLYSEVLHRHGHAAPAQRIAEFFPLVLQELACRVPTGRDRFAAHPRGSRGYWRDVLDRLGEYLEIAPSRFAAAELWERFSHAEAWQVYPEVPGVLRELQRRGLRMAIASNWDERLARLLDELELAPFFDRILVSSEIGAPKPHPAMFQALLDELCVTADEMFHVGDARLEDGEGAEAVGIRALVLDRSAGDTLERVWDVLGESRRDFARPRSQPPNVGVDL